MKPLEGYRNVTDVFVKKPCEKEGCTRVADIPTSFDEKTKEFKNWYCLRHAKFPMKVFTKRST